MEYLDVHDEQQTAKTVTLFKPDLDYVPLMVCFPALVDGEGFCFQVDQRLIENIDAPLTCSHLWKMVFALKPVEVILRPDVPATFFDSNRA